MLFFSVKCLGRCVEIFLLRFCFQVLVIWSPIFVRVNLVEQSQRDRIMLKTAHMFIFYPCPKLENHDNVSESKARAV